MRTHHPHQRVPAQQTPRRGRRWRFLTVALAGVMTVAGCGLGQSESAITATPTVTAPPDTRLARYYEQELQWGACPQGTKGKVRCAVAQMPLDYANPEGGDIEVMLARAENTGGPNKPALLINPGGPGGSGVGFLAVASQILVSDAVKGAYTLVSFDPRGVGHSTPVQCLTDAETDRMRAATFDMSQPQWADQARTLYRDYAQQCRDRAGAILNHVDTESAARDLDIMRALLGGETLNYLGYSYGSFLGATYARLFPSRVGRLVLDGNLAGSYSMPEVAAAQAGGFAAALDHYLEQCLAAQSCPVEGDVPQARARLEEFVGGLLAQPLPTADPQRPLNDTLAVQAILGSLYSPLTADKLTAALDEALNQGSGTQLLGLADSFAGRNPDGHYESNQFDAFNAINFLDYAVEGDFQQWHDQAVELQKRYPLVGQSFGYTILPLEAWQSVNPAAGKGQREATRVPLTQPILLVNPTDDPATPLAMAEAVQAQFPTSALVKWQSYNHTAYGWGSRCIDGHVDAYLLRGQTPPAGTVCTD